MTVWFENQTCAVHGRSMDVRGIFTASTGLDLNNRMIGSFSASSFTGVLRNTSLQDNQSDYGILFNAACTMHSYETSV